MTTETLRALALRCEEATGPDRRLDAEIACAVRFPTLRPAEPDDFEGEHGYSAGNIKVDTGFLMSESYSRSIDAAATLVPKGFDWAVFRTNGGLTIHAWCGSREDVFGQTPALALCAAALIARSQEEVNG